MNEGKKFGVITEQGFTAGQYGFKPLNEQDNSKVQEKKDAKKDQK